MSDIPPPAEEPSCRHDGHQPASACVDCKRLADAWSSGAPAVPGTANETDPETADADGCGSRKDTSPSGVDIVYSAPADDGTAGADAIACSTTTAPSRARSAVDAAMGSR